MLKQVFLALSLLQAFAASAEQAADGCARLPRSVADRALKDFPKAHVVTQHDLHGDDQALWAAAYGGACPGWTSGTFRPGSRQYAVSIVDSSVGGLAQALLLVDVSHADRKPLVLSPMQQVAQVSVVRRLPGERGRLDAVIYEAMEAGTMVFSWAGREFRSEVTSE